LYVQWALAAIVVVGKGSIPIDHVSIGHHPPQRPVPRGFPLFKRCEWLVSNRFVSKRRPPVEKQCYALLRDPKLWINPTSITTKIWEVWFPWYRIVDKNQFRKWLWCESVLWLWQTGRGNAVANHRLVF